jgi:hypothetical protein
MANSNEASIARLSAWVDFDTTNKAHRDDDSRLGISYEGYPLTRGDLKRVLNALTAETP